MDITELWQRALKETRIFRKRIASLDTFDQSALPYILVCDDRRTHTVVRRGHVVISKPALMVPDHHPMFEGFDFESMQVGENTISTMLYVRGIHLPTVNVKNLQTQSLYDGDPADAVAQYGSQLQRDEDVKTGLIGSDEAFWPLSLLFYTSTLIAKNIPKDLERMIQKIRDEGHDQ